MFALKTYLLASFLLNAVMTCALPSSESKNVDCPGCRFIKMNVEDLGLAKHRVTRKFTPDRLPSKSTFTATALEGQRTWTLNPGELPSINRLLRAESLDMQLEKDRMTVIRLVLLLWAFEQKLSSKVQQISTPKVDQLKFRSQGWDTHHRGWTVRVSKAGLILDVQSYLLEPSP